MKLKHYLEKYNISQTDFSKKIGVTQTAISCYTNDKRTPKLSIIKDIEKATKGEVTFQDFLPS